MFRIDLEKKPSWKGSRDYKKPRDEKIRRSSKSFSLVSLALCITAGIMVGRIGVSLPYIGKFSLGTTGGALVVSLVFGAMGRVGPLDMRMDKEILAVLRSFSLAYFFATVGLQAGPQVAETFAEYGILLISIGIFAALFSELIAFLVGRYLLRLNWILLAGAICGAMTSTPGLGAAIRGHEGAGIAGRIQERHTPLPCFAWSCSRNCLSILFSLVQIPEKNSIGNIPKRASQGLSRGDDLFEGKKLFIQTWS